MYRAVDAFSKLKEAVIWRLCHYSFHFSKSIKSLLRKNAVQSCGLLLLHSIYLCSMPLLEAY